MNAGKHQNYKLFTYFSATGTVRSEDEDAATIDEDPVVEDDIGKAADASRTDDEVIER